MKTFCTGPRNIKEQQNLEAIDGWHGLYGHINIKEPDQKAACTGYGKHDRVIATAPDKTELYCRIDHIWGLGTPSEKEILAVVKETNGCLGGRWHLEKSEEWEDGTSTDVFFTKSKL